MVKAKWKKMMLLNLGVSLLASFLIGTNVTAATNDPVVYLEFQNNTDDSSGRGNNATANGTISYLEGLIGNTADFDTTSDYVTFGTPDDLNFGTSTDFTVSLWIKSAGVSGDPSIISNKDWQSGNNNGWIIALDGNTWQWNFKGASGSKKDMDVGGNINDNQWHNLVVSHDRDGYADFYQDGIKFNSVYIGDSTGTIDTGLPTVIGQDGTLAYGQALNSSLDDVRIFRHALTEEDVLSIYNTSKKTDPTFPPIPSPNPGSTNGNDPVVYLEFQNNTDDSSGRGNNARANGTISYLEGLIGNTADFDATSDYATFGTPADLNFGTSTDFTVSLWIKSAGVSGDPPIISNKNWQSGDNKGWIIALDGNTWQWNFKGASGSKKDMDVGGNINDNQWHNLVVSHDRDGYADFYQDGIKFNSVYIGDSTGTIDTGLPTVIGQDGTLAYGKALNSSLDDVRIFRHALTEEDVLSIYNTAKKTNLTLTPMPSPSSGPYNVYFGDLHAHTGYSDGMGIPEEAFLQAKNSGKGDFFAVTDHSYSLTSDEYKDIIVQANNYTDSNFVSIAAFEETTSWGHMNTFNTQGYALDGTKEAYYNWLTNTSGSLAMFNHPAENTEFEDFTDYSEAINSHVKLIEMDNNYRDELRTFESSFIKALDKGWKLAPTAASDTHTKNWLTGYDIRTAVLAPSLTRENILDAINNRRVYATEDRNLKVNYSINGSVMGSTLSAPSTFNFAIHAEDPDTNVAGDKITKIEIFTDKGMLVQSNIVNAYTVDWNPTITSSVTSYYYVKLTTADGQRAWTAPIWTGNATENPIIIGTGGKATYIGPSGTMKMVILPEKNPTWSVTDVDGNPTTLATIDSETGILKTGASTGTIKVVATYSGKTASATIKIDNTELKTVDNSDSKITYTQGGSSTEWTTYAEDTRYGESETYIKPKVEGPYSSDVKAEFTFTGTGVQWIGMLNSAEAQADVYIDGIKMATVDPYYDETVTQHINYSIEGLPYGSHTIKIVNVGAKNSACTSNNYDLSIDAFRYISGIEEGAIIKRPQLTNLTAGIKSLNIKYNAVDGATSYNIKYGKTTGNYNEVIKEVTDTSYTIADLEEGAEYYVVVSAVINGAESENSNELSQTTYSTDPNTIYYVNCGDETTDVLEDGEKFGTFNSKEDQSYGLDSSTGYQWGYIADENKTWSQDKQNENGVGYGCLRQYDGSTSGGGITYKFEVPNGKYNVIMGFYDPWDHDGRLEDIFINEKAVAENLCPKTIGKVPQTYAASVEDGTLTFRAQKSAGADDKPLISWIKVIKEVSYNVTYDANGGEGSVPADNTNYSVGDTVKVKENTLSNAGYKFVGWNTSADGSGTNYDPTDLGNNTLTMGESNVTLYAQWKDNTVPVTTPAAVVITKDDDNLTAKLEKADGSEFTTNEVVAYDWYRNSELINGGNDNTYELSEADKGTSIKVKVEQYSLVSKAVEIPNNSTDEPITEVTTPAAVVITKDNDNLTAKLKKADGSEFTTNEVVAYDWYRNSELVNGGNDNTYELSEADKGTSIKVKVEQYGLVSKAVEIPNNSTDEPITEVTTQAAVAVELTREEDTVTAKLKKADGSEFTTNEVVTYEWYRNSKLVDEKNDNKYKLSDADKGKGIKVKLGQYGLESEVIEIPNDSTDEPISDVTTPAAVRIKGEERVDNTLSYEFTSNGKVVSIDSNLDFKWYRLVSINSEDGELAGEGETYRLISSDKGKYIKLVAAYKNNIFEDITSKIMGNSSNHSSSSSSNHSSKSNNQTVTPPINNNQPIQTLPEGWVQVSNEWKYLKESQAVVGWNQINGNWYLMDSKGKMETGWKELNGNWYLLKNDGAMATGWQQVNNKWYLLNNSGTMQTGWKQVDNKWYYLKQSGDMVTGWISDNGTWYYLDQSGSMLSNTVVDGYKLGENGALI